MAVQGQFRVIQGAVTCMIYYGRPTQHRRNFVFCLTVVCSSLGLNLKIRHGAVVDNIVANLCVKLDDDRL